MILGKGWQSYAKCQNAKMVGIQTECQPFSALMFYFEYNSTINCSLILSGIESRCG